VNVTLFLVAFGFFAAGFALFLHGAFFWTGSLAFFTAVLVVFMVICRFLDKTAFIECIISYITG